MAKRTDVYRNRPFMKYSGDDTAGGIDANKLRDLAELLASGGGYASSAGMLGLPGGLSAALGALASGLAQSGSESSRTSASFLKPEDALGALAGGVVRSVKDSIPVKGYKRYTLEDVLKTLSEESPTAPPPPSVPSLAGPSDALGALAGGVVGGAKGLVGDESGSEGGESGSYWDWMKDWGSRQWDWAKENYLPLSIGGGTALASLIGLYLLHRYMKKRRKNEKNKR
ncbi:MAG: hypothetical protein QXP01_03930 [Candidatus Hadarchaeum sp.]